MSRTAIILAIGLLGVAIGIVGLLGAHEFSNGHHYIGDIDGVPAYMNGHDATAETAYRIIGSASLVFGLGMIALASYCWMRSETTPPDKKEWVKGAEDI